MGFDISYHPISETEMNDWYFGLDFSKIDNEDYSEMIAIGEKFNLDPFYIGKYIDTVRAMYHNTKGEFDIVHGYAMAVIQGFFRTYYYTRGTAFSFLIEAKPAYSAYTKKWEDILTREYDNPIRDHIFQNYCSGVFIPADKVVELLHDYENKADVRKDLDESFGSNIPVFLKALKMAKENDLGVLEATEVVEPNPFDLNSSSSYSDLFNCDKEGVFIYEGVAKKQLAEAIAANSDKSADEVNVDELNVHRHVTHFDINAMETSEKLAKKSFWQKIFGKK